MDYHGCHDAPSEVRLPIATAEDRKSNARLHDRLYERVGALHHRKSTVSANVQLTPARTASLVKARNRELNLMHLCIPFRYGHECSSSRSSSLNWFCYRSRTVIDWVYPHADYSANFKLVPKVDRSF